MIRTILFSAVLLVPSSLFAGDPQLRMCLPGERNTPSKTCLVDGDTVWLNGVDYRLKDFDTPEPQTDICGGVAEVELAHKASQRMLQLLNSNAWTIQTFGLDETRKRTLATIRIGGRDVGDILIEEHFGAPMARRRGVVVSEITIVAVR